MQIEHDPNEGKPNHLSSLLKLGATVAPMAIGLCYVRGDFDGLVLPEAVTVVLGGLGGAAAFIFFGYLLCKAWDLTFGKIAGRIRNRRNA